MRAPLQLIEPALLLLQLRAERFLRHGLRHVEIAENRRGRRRVALLALAGRRFGALRLAAPGCCRRRRRRLCGGTHTAILRERLVDGVANRRRDRDAAVGLVLAFDDEPRRVHHAGLPHRLLGGLDESVVHPPVLPLLLADPPAGERILLQLAQPALLLTLSEMHPELEDEGVVRGQRALELHGAIEPAREIRLAAVPVDAIENRPRVPRAQEQADASARRQVAPVAPVFGPVPLLVRRLTEGARDQPAWIHPLAEQVDRLAFSRAIDAGEDDDHRERRRARQAALHVEQFAAQRELLFLVVSLVDLASELRRFEHVCPSVQIAIYWSAGFESARTAASVAALTSSTGPCPGIVTSSLIRR